MRRPGQTKYEQEQMWQTYTVCEKSKTEVVSIKLGREKDRRRCSNGNTEYGSEWILKFER